MAGDEVPAQEGFFDIELGGLSRDEAIRAAAVQASATCWAGMAVFTSTRAEAVIRDAERIERYIRGEDHED